LCARIIHLVDGNLESEKGVYVVGCMYLIVGVVILFAKTEQEVWKKNGSAYDQGVKVGVL
jgi:hypothetical protein